MSVAENLKHWRQVRGLTQPELAERADIEQSYLSKLENGHSQASEAVRERLAAALGIDTDTLLRSPSRNGQVRRMSLAGVVATTLLVAGFTAGYLASDYELRKVNHDPERLVSVVSLAPEGIQVRGVTRMGPEMHNVDGHFDDAKSVTAFATALLRHGVIGTEFVSMKLSDTTGTFHITIMGTPRLPAESDAAQAD